MILSNELHHICFGCLSNYPEKVLNLDGLYIPFWRPDILRKIGF
jgi:hypothetical protein